MANPLRGEASFTSNGVEYTVRVDIESIMHFEDVTNKPFYTFTEELDLGEYRVGDLVRMVQCFLNHHHGAITKDVAGSIIFDSDSPGAAVDAIKDAVNRAFPSATSNNGAGQADASKKNDGTG